VQKNKKGGKRNENYTNRTYDVEKRGLRRKKRGKGGRSFYQKKGIGKRYMHGTARGGFSTLNVRQRLQPAAHPRNKT